MRIRIHKKYGTIVIDQIVDEPVDLYFHADGSVSVNINPDDDSDDEDDKLEPEPYLSGRLPGRN
jgi:hypothetical protein